MTARLALTVRLAAWAWAALALAILAAAAPPALADRYEAVIAVRPSLGYAYVAEAGTRDRDRVRATGLAGGFARGVRNWLDLGGELVFASLDEARYDEVMLRVDDDPMTGPLQRRSQIMQLRGTATLRLGVAWVPTLQLAVGPGLRVQSSALLSGQSVRGATTYVPDGLDAGFALDLVAAVRVGFEHRFGRSWSAGISASAMRTIGIGASDLRLADVSVSLARLWYPSW